MQWRVPCGRICMALVLGPGHRSLQAWLLCLHLSEPSLLLPGLVVLPLFVLYMRSIYLYSNSSVLHLYVLYPSVSVVCCTALALLPMPVSVCFQSTSNRC